MGADRFCKLCGNRLSDRFCEKCGLDSWLATGHSSILASADEEGAPLRVGPGNAGIEAGASHKRIHRPANRFGGTIVIATIVCAIVALVAIVLMRREPLDSSIAVPPSTTQFDESAPTAQHDYSILKTWNDSHRDAIVVFLGVADQFRREAVSSRACSAWLPVLHAKIIDFLGLRGARADGSDRPDEWYLYTQEILTAAESCAQGDSPESVAFFFDLADKNFKDILLNG
jgi:hypothetical protein